MAENLNAWPELSWTEWQATADTLHMWTQIVGKTRLALTPLQNHWWNVPLYVSACGLTTSPMPTSAGLLEIEFDFLAHQLEFRLSTGETRSFPLRPQSVAAFFAEYQSILKSLGVEVAIWPMPVEVSAPIRFDLDETHASYDRDAVERFHCVLMSCDTVFKRFATKFLGKISPVHFFWGSFDLCVTRFSGRVAGGPPRPDRIQAEAYSHEVISCGFWPGNGGFGSAALGRRLSTATPRRCRPGWEKRRYSPERGTRQWESFCCRTTRFVVRQTPLRRFWRFWSRPTRRRRTRHGGIEPRWTGYRPD